MVDSCVPYNRGFFLNYGESQQRAYMSLANGSIFFRDYDYPCKLHENLFTRTRCFSQKIEKLPGRNGRFKNVSVGENFLGTDMKRERISGASCIFPEDLCVHTSLRDLSLIRIHSVSRERL